MVKKRLGTIGLNHLESAKLEAHAITNQYILPTSQEQKAWLLLLDMQKLANEAFNHMGAKDYLLASSCRSKAYSRNNSMGMILNQEIKALQGNKGQIRWAGTTRTL